MYRSVPPHHDFGRIQVVVYRGEAFDGLQAAEPCLAVVLLEDLRVGVLRELAPLQLQQKRALLPADAPCRTVAGVGVHQHRVSLPLVGVEFLAQPRRVLRKRVPGGLPQLLAGQQHAVPRLRTPGEPAFPVLGFALLLHPRHLVHHLGVQDVFQLSFGADFGAVFLEEPHRFGVEAYPRADVSFVFPAFHFLPRFLVAFVVGCTEPVGHRPVCHQRFAAVAAAPDDSQLAVAGIFVVSRLTY